MEIKLNSFVIEAAIDNCYKVMRKYLQLPLDKSNRCVVLDFREFKSGWADYMKYIDGRKDLKYNLDDKQKLPNGIEFVDMSPYESFEEYLKDLEPNTKNVVMIKLSKTVVSNVDKCEEILFKILENAFGNDNMNNWTLPFKLQSKKSVYVGLPLSY